MTTIKVGFVCSEELKSTRKGLKDSNTTKLSFKIKSGALYETRRNICQVLQGTKNPPLLGSSMKLDSEADLHHINNCLILPMNN